MFFDGLNSVVRVVLIGTLAYAALVILLPASGNCTLSKMNSFEFVITAALGSALSALLTDSSLALVTGLTAIALLILLQFGMTWLSVRSRSLNLSPPPWHRSCKHWQVRRRARFKPVRSLQ